MTKTNLNRGLLLRINETISNLERRVSINAQTILPLENVNLNDSQQNGIGALQTMEAIEAQNKRALLAIEECKEAVHKLELIRSFIQQLNYAEVQSFLHTYNNFTLGELHTNLKKKVSSQKNYTQFVRGNYFKTD